MAARRSYSDEEQAEVPVSTGERFERIFASLDKAQRLTRELMDDLDAEEKAARSTPYHSRTGA